MLGERGLSSLKIRSKHLWVPSIRGPRALATDTYRWVPTSNRQNRRGRPHLGDTHISLGSPAVALIVANDRGRRRCCTKSQQPNGHQDPLPRCFISVSLSF